MISEAERHLINRQDLEREVIIGLNFDQARYLARQLFLPDSAIINNPWRLRGLDAVGLKIHLTGQYDRRDDFNLIRDALAVLEMRGAKVVHTNV